jgi:hypothetical protein
LSKISSRTGRVENNQELLRSDDRGGNSGELRCPEAGFAGNSHATRPEVLSPAMALKGRKVPLCGATGSLFPCLGAGALLIEQLQTKLSIPSQWDFPWLPEWDLCTGHIPSVQQERDEPEAACAKPAPMLPRRAISRIIARRRCMVFSYHRRAFQNK